MTQEPSVFHSTNTMDRDSEDTISSKRSRIAVACDTCRKRKIRCSGNRPICDQCMHSEKACVYSEPKKRGRKLQEHSDHTGDHHSAIKPESGDEFGPLSNMATLLVSLEDTGSIHAMRTMGNSSGLQCLNEWSSIIQEGVVVLPKRNLHRPSNADIDSADSLPPPEVMVQLLNFYFDSLNQFLPILNRTVVFRYLDGPDPPLLLLYTVLALSSKVYETIYEEEPPPKVAASEILFQRARSLIFTVLDSAPCLENIQALVLLALFDCGTLRGPSSWMLSGMAIRLAQDMGLNRNVEHLTARFKLSKYELHTMRKVFWGAFILDRFVSAVHGRPLSIFDDDIDVSLPTESGEAFLDTADDYSISTASPPPGDSHLIEDFCHIAQLSEIQGRILQNLNSARHGSSSSLPELHKSLSSFFNDLPERLRYSFHPTSDARCSSPVGAFLNMKYYTVVILLYRPYISSKSSAKSPLFNQYLSICCTASKAIVHIAATNIKDLPIYPSIVVYHLFTALTTLVISYTAAEKERKNVTVSLLKLMPVLEQVERIYKKAGKIRIMLIEFLTRNGIQKNDILTDPEYFNRPEYLKTKFFDYGYTSSNEKNGVSTNGNPSTQAPGNVQRKDSHHSTTSPSSLTLDSNVKQEVTPFSLSSGAAPPILGPLSHPSQNFNTTSPPQFLPTEFGQILPQGGPNMPIPLPTSTIPPARLTQQSQLYNQNADPLLGLSGIYNTGMGLDFGIGMDMSLNTQLPLEQFSQPYGSQASGPGAQMATVPSDYQFDQLHLEDFVGLGLDGKQLDILNQYINTSF